LSIAIAKMLATPLSSKVTWEKLPEDYVLPSDPVGNINQPPLAAALTESLELAGELPSTAITPTNYGICATLDGQMVVKAPDWAYVPTIRVPREDVERSYTPILQGDIPVIVVEFISNAEGVEYSTKPTYPPGKWFFYEQVLQVPNYLIFEPATGALEAYRLQASGRYQVQPLDENDHFQVAEMNLLIGAWQGTRENRTGYWLRWWDEGGNLLPWRTEVIEQERQRVEQERQRVERLAAQLRAAGIEPEI